MGLSRVNHGLDKTRFSPKNPGFSSDITGSHNHGSVTGKSWVRHGLLNRPDFSPSKYWKKQKNVILISYLKFPVSPGTYLVGPSATALHEARKGKLRHILVMYFCGPRPRKEHSMLAWSYVLFRSSAKKGTHELCTFVVLGHKRNTPYIIMIISWDEFF